MSRVYQIEFTDYEKEKNKELSRYGRKCPQEKETMAGIERCDSNSVDSFFYSMRVMYYGDNWLELLFPSLFFNKC